MPSAQHRDNPKVARWLRTPVIMAGAILGVMGCSAIVAAVAIRPDIAVARGSAASKQQSSPAKGRHFGFVVTYFWYAMYQGKDACPNGLNHIANSQEFLASKPPAERARLLLPENQAELDEIYDRRGPNGENLCRTPWAVKDAAMTTLSGDRNDGLNLDGWDGTGEPSTKVCKQKQFIGGDGTKGIDNQLGRIYACLNGVREKGTLIPYFTTAMRGGMWSMLIDVSGVQDARNDPDVRVDIYAGAENMVLDAGGKPLPNASLSPITDPKFHRQFKGHIINGVLETETIADLVVPDDMAKGRKPVQIVEPRFKISLLPDGTAKGLLGGYRTVASLDEPGSGGLRQSYGGYVCEGMYHAIRRWADGARDPKTGTCGMISAAWRIEAVPAFIVHPERQAQPSFADAKR